ncbi:HEAT repeat domain-containing protein [Roseofilum casamattae]|uniref:HEAT repeat domain-containing protein n=1 Tax=Roseofilum casamattae BLCC-M143 TaxID=3022442 RepID=A0ABT7BVP9_9CYAN|nr:HEAT repeat domain-containing protein [Roseofilum casamattae]MDJ1182584.1 HEAT repeat domain-containing protein [Roseofilum casamattae BLCC-M143]
MKGLKTTRARRSPIQSREDRDISALSAQFYQSVQDWKRQDSQVWVGRESELLELGLEVLALGDFQVRWDAAKLLPELGTMAIAPLLEWLADEDAEEELRWFAGSILETFNQPDTIAVLAEVLQKTDSEALRQLVSQILGSYGTSALPTLKELLATEHTRNWAVRALSCICDRQVVDLLLDVIPDRDPQVYAQALEILSCWRDPRAIPALMKGLESTMSKVRYAAVVGLGIRAKSGVCPSISTEQVVKGLRDRLWDFNLSVCEQAAMALGRLATVSSAIALHTIMRSESTPESLRITAIRSLGWIAEDRADPVSQPAYLALQCLLEMLYPGILEENSWLELVQALGRVQHWQLQQQGSAALVKCLQERSLSLRVQGAIALNLGYLQQEDAISTLVELASQEDMTVRLHAIAGLKALGVSEYPKL